MSDDSAIRRANLRTLCERRGLTPTALSATLGSRQSYWSDLLSGNKSFGEKAARRIEDGLGLQRYELDAAAPQQRLTGSAPDEKPLSAANVLAALAGMLERASDTHRPALVATLRAFIDKPEAASRVATLVDLLSEPGASQDSEAASPVPSRKQRRS